MRERIDQSEFEALIRRALRDEADAVQIRVDAGSLERRWSDRQRRRTQRMRLLAVAAGIAVAIGGGLLILRGTSVPLPVAAPPTPATGPSESQPLPSPLPDERPRLGVTEPGTSGDPKAAVLVRPTPESLAVAAVAADGSSSSLAMIPTDVLPPGRLEFGYYRPRVSEFGWLALPVVTNELGDTGGVAIVDLYDPTAEPWFVDGLRLEPGLLSWGPDGWLAAMADDRIAILDPGRREARELTVPSGINIVAASSQGLIWTADGAGILGARSRGERFDAGVISAEDGSFEVTTRSVPTYQATGLGRAFGADGSTLGWACDDGVGPGATGCFIDRISVDGTRTMWYPDTLGPPAPLDALFTADGVDVWMILPPEAGDPLVARFPEPNQYTIVGEAPRVGPDVPTFTGISDDDSILVSDPGDVRTMLLRPDSGEAVEVDGVFAGWEAGGTYP